jgi:tight adherence protein B
VISPAALLTDPAVHKWTAIALLAAGTSLFVRESAMNPRSTLARGASAHVSQLNGRLKSLFRPQQATPIAWLQACGSLALIALRFFVASDLLLVGAALVAIGPTLVLDMLVARRLRALKEQVPSFALALANALKTTASIGDAVQTTLAIATNPLRQELDTALKQIHVGSTLDEALLEMAGRARAPSLDVVVSALLIGRQTGGDLPRILETTATSLRELARLEELTEKVTRDSKRALLLAAALAGLMVIALPRLIPGFFDPLRDTPRGQAIALQCLVAYVFALFLGFRFLKVNV